VDVIYRVRCECPRLSAVLNFTSPLMGY
jgi:hypothetical protein